jgi:uncharacterized protein YodC (DUF2158 family)
MVDFKPGDVVQLKSGGPLLTVSIVSGPAVTCEWFDDRQQVLVRAFGAVSLKQANNSPAPNQRVDSSSLREKKTAGAAAQRSSAAAVAAPRPPAVAVAAQRPAATAAAAPRPPAVAVAAQRPAVVAAAAERPTKAKGEAISPVPNGGAPAL